MHEEGGFRHQAVVHASQNRSMAAAIGFCDPWIIKQGIVSDKDMHPMAARLNCGAEACPGVLYLQSAPNPQFPIERVEALEVDDRSLEAPVDHLALLQYCCRSRSAAEKPHHT